MTSWLNPPTVQRQVWEHAQKLELTPQATVDEMFATAKHSLKQADVNAMNEKSFEQLSSKKMKKKSSGVY